MKVKLITLALLALTACSGKPTIKYTDPTSIDTNTVHFSSTDLQSVTAKMVDDMLIDPHIVTLTGEQRPVLFVSGLANDTSEHIQTQAIMDAITTRLIQSRRFNFVDMDQVEKVKEQFQYQQSSGLVDPNKAAMIGRQVGARFMLYGSIASITTDSSTQKRMYYQVTLRLLDIESGLVEWSSEKQISKTAERARFGW